VRNHAPYGAIALLVAAGLVGRWLVGSSNAAQSSMPHARFGPSAVKVAARRLCLRIRPEMQVQHVDVEPEIVYDGRHTFRRLWCAACSDATGIDITLRWNDETGKLIWASTNAIAPAQPNPRIGSADAIRASIHWLHELGPRTEEPDWRPYGALHSNLQSWVVRLRSKSATAIVNINSFNGSLQTLDIRH